ncbi:UDP-glucoronosyl and UDP-glucosyl transferase [Ancylostoma ceylanicum]|uniref:UDP-glucuronosyltransferase n=1 Tax=Ancylostoma ceylanicum TaxID=53326 RepID=A0A0D6M977_9BILA|nr:UDP-glucoronosyl and UDP-glucosyl transferase [Ancylostoma ceylanicum]
MPLLTVGLILTAICVPTVALNILVWSSTMGQSHINFIGNIADTLREDGHNVVSSKYSSPYHNSADWRTLTFKQGVVFNSIFGLNFIDLTKMQIYGYRVCKGFILANIYEYFEQSLFESKFPGFKNLHDLIKDKTDYMLMNTNEFTESTRPTLRSIQYVGGSATPDPQPLDEEFEWIVSRGAKAFLDAFATFTDYVILWKDDTHVNSSYPNIYFRDWVPQVDLLADGRVKLFITHGGMNSMQESLLFGIPMITVPLFADQDSNAAVAAERGFSVNLSKFSVTKEKVIDAINKVLGKDGEESTYTQKVRQAARLLKGSPEEMRRAIKRLARISGTEPPLKHLKLDLDHLNNFQYYNIDIYLLLLSIVLVHLWICARVSMRIADFFTALKKKTD